MEGAVLHQPSPSFLMAQENPAQHSGQILQGRGAGPRPPACLAWWHWDGLPSIKSQLWLQFCIGQRVVIPRALQSPVISLFGLSLLFNAHKTLNPNALTLSSFASYRRGQTSQEGTSWFFLLCSHVIGLCCKGQFSLSSTSYPVHYGH